jgi:Ca2+-binding RTX toxin-like protein
MTTKHGDASDNILVGTDGNDRMDGRGGDDSLDGLGGNDTLLGGDGKDQLDGGDGNDTLDGGAGKDTMEGGNGDDTFYYSDFFDHLHGGDGFDTISFEKTGHGITLTNASWNSAGGDVTGCEQIIGSKYADYIDQTGGPPDSGVVIHGGGGDDYITGDGPLYGDKGNDQLVPQGVNQFGSTNNTIVYGGTGHDTFEIYFTDRASGFTGEGAVIEDFVHGTDHLLFNGAEDPGTLSNTGGDNWAIHDDAQGVDVSFEIVGVTHLDTSDYTFV